MHTTDYRRTKWHEWNAFIRFVWDSNSICFGRLRYLCATTRKVKTNGKTKCHYFSVSNSERSEFLIIWCNAFRAIKYPRGGKQQISICSFCFLYFFPNEIATIHMNTYIYDKYESIIIEGNSKEFVEFWFIEIHENSIMNMALFR